MTHDLERLKGLAEAATPGPWQIGTGPNTGQRCVWGPGDPYTEAPWICGEIVNRREFVEGEANAAFIAAANPQTILSLIQLIEDRDGALEEAREFIDRFSDVEDGSYGEPVPNRAMTLVAAIDELIPPRQSLTAEPKEKADD